MIVSLGAGRTASPELRERIALDPEAVVRLLTGPRHGLGELVALSTCHRTELYATTDDAADADAPHLLARLLPGIRPGDQAELRFLRGGEAIEHLLRVASGLDSLVIGEHQILGQVRRAFSTAASHHAAGPVLASVFSEAIRVGRLARSRILLGSAATSIGTLVAGDLAARLDGLAGRPGAVVGTGEAAADASLALRTAGARLSIIGRSLDSVRRLAARVEGGAHSLDALPGVLASSDFAVVAVAGGVLLREAHVAGRTAPLAIVDVSVPRAVAIKAHTAVHVRTLDDLSPVAASAAVSDANAAVRAAAAALVRRLDPGGRRRDIAALRAHAERVARGEAARAIGGMDLSPQQTERIEAMARRIAAKLVHGPTVAMRDGDEAIERTVRAMFNLEHE